MRGHLYSLHMSILLVVEIGMEIPDSDNKDYNPVEAEQLIHRNAQAAIVLLSYLCMEEYKNVNGLESAKDIWDILKIVHEGDKITKIVKMELLEGELGRVAMINEESPQ